MDTTAAAAMTTTTESGLSSYSLFRSVGSEPTHLWSQPVKATHTEWTSSNRKSGDEDLDQLFVFGYSCKLFRDDRRAQELDSGQHLIGWNGSTDHLIDRFDVRGYLHDLSPFDVNHKPIAEQLTPEELEIERLCDEERYADLNCNDIDDNHDEEIKRWHLALSEGSGYNQISYNYDQNNAPIVEPAAEVTTEQSSQTIEELDRFKLPSGLSPPENILLPESQKLHNIIEKTALFVSKHGLQMEIILKTKQSANKQFDFLSFDSQLYLYYKYILESIKSGKYTPNANKSSDNSDDSDDDSSDGEHYLHPSLLGSSSSAKSNTSHTFNIPNLLRMSNTDDSYSQLVKSFKDKFPHIKDPPIETLELVVPQTKPFVSVDSESSKTQTKVCVTNTLPTTTTTTWSSLLPSPPPEIEHIIEKLAQRVATNGEQFESSIKKLGEQRFEFVNPGHIYHAHYIRRKLHYLDENRKASAAQLKLSNNKNNNNTKSESNSSRHKTPVCFSINTKSESKSSAQLTTNCEDNALTVGQSSKVRDDVECVINTDISAKRMSDNALKDKLALAVRERAAKDKQEERKRKAALFITLLKSKSKEQAKGVENNDTFCGPKMPKPNTSTNSAPLSPTIGAVTSPNVSPIRDTKSGANDSSLLDTVLTHKCFETTAKSGSLLPFIVSDKPLKESSRMSSPRHSSHHSKSRHSTSSSHKKSHKRKRSPNSRSRSTSRSPSRSSRSRHRKRESKSRSRSRSRSHSRSHKRH